MLKAHVLFLQAGMYTMGDGSLSKASFSSMEVPGFGNAKRVPTIESLFPFQKNGFSASGACKACERNTQTKSLQYPQDVMLMCSKLRLRRNGQSCVDYSDRSLFHGNLVHDKM